LKLYQTTRIVKALGISLQSFVVLLSLISPARAVPTKNWSIDWRSSLEQTTNLAQQENGEMDQAWRNSLELSYFPINDSENSALFRIQGLNQRYRFNQDFASTFLIATATASRKIIDNTYLYGGDQYLYKQADIGNGSAPTRQDNDLFFGAVNYQFWPLGLTSYVGYQYDFLRAAVAQASYQGQAAYITFRHRTFEKVINTASYRSQWRFFDNVSANQWRNIVTVESSYQWASYGYLDMEVFYQNAWDNRPEFSFNGWNFAIFNRISI
jgi:hypothetical protein